MRMIAMVMMNAAAVVFIVIALAIAVLLLLLLPCSKVLRTQKLKTHPLRTKSSKIFPLKPDVGRNIATHALPTARNFFLPNFCLPSPFIFIFLKNLFRVFFLFFFFFSPFFGVSCG